MAETPQPPVIEEISFKDAIKLVGSKPDGSDRKDLITFWGFAKKNWRWCMDAKMSLEDAIALHAKLGEEVKVVVGKKQKKEKEPKK